LPVWRSITLTQPTMPTAAHESRTWIAGHSAYEEGRRALQRKARPGLRRRVWAPAHRVAVSAGYLRQSEGSKERQEKSQNSDQESNDGVCFYSRGYQDPAGQQDRRRGAASAAKRAYG